MCVCVCVCVCIAASEELAQIEARIKELGKTISASKAKATRLKNQEDMLDEYAGGLVEVGKDANSADLISAHTTGNSTGTYTTHYIARA